MFPDGEQDWGSWKREEWEEVQVSSIEGSPFEFGLTVRFLTVVVAPL